MKTQKILIIPALIVWSLMTLCSCKAQIHYVNLSVDVNHIEDVEKVSVLGNLSPLSWGSDYPMTDMDKDGIYRATIPVKNPKKALRFKFKVNDEIEMQGSDNRALSMTKISVNGDYVFNEYNVYNRDEVEDIVFTPTEIEEDVALLKQLLEYLHPSIYTFRDSVDLQKDFALLEENLKANPNLTNAYGAISKLVAKIKCSHTFTNPWNQGYRVDKALLYQRDKIPFTFNRIDHRLFIDKNASNNDQLKKGLEILSINDVSTDTVLSRLTAYVSSDGNNYSKKLDRLSVTGHEKYSLFDIFYPIEFGSSESFKLKLQDIETQDIIETDVQAMSKTNRTRILMQRYGSLGLSFEDGWKFEILNKETALLKIRSFAVQEKGFDWKNFLDNTFEQVNTKEIQNLIIDIRENEGGQGEVGEYILERLITTPMEVPPMQASVRYLDIPKSYQKHINTWAKFPYDFKGKYVSVQNGKYLLKQKYSVGGKTYKPRKDGYKGAAYLITDASNSSATHIMASFAKLSNRVTLVGQTTGGNQLGTNGSFIFFLRLPNTKIVVDIPVIHQYVPISDHPEDGGVEPDVVIERSPEDLINGVDREVNTILEIIRQKS